MTGYTNYKNIIKKKFLPQKGQVLVVTVLFLVCLLGITALVVDAGSLYQKRAFYQTVADSGALAGAQELPENPDGARNAAVDYTALHNVPLNPDNDVQIDYDTIMVTLSNIEAPLYFASIFGKDTAGVGASATAMVGKPVEMYNTVPWAAVIPEGTGWESWLGSVAGEEKIISGELEDSDFVAWDTTSHPGQWNSRYRDRIINGYREPLEVGDSIYTREISITPTGNAVESRVDIWDDFNELIQYDGGIIKLAKNDDQFVIVPLIYDTELLEWWEEYPEEWPEVWVEIEAFAPFILTGIETTGHGRGHGSKTEVKGRFIHQALIIQEGEIEAFNTQGLGFKVIRLIR